MEDINDGSGLASPPQSGGSRRAADGIAMRARLGSLRRKVGEMIERALHPTRRRRACGRLRRLGEVERVLFVCHGNIYRSPYAEAAFRAQLPPELRERILAVSAGFVGPGRPAPEASVALAQTRGLDLRGHRSQLLTPALVKESNLVVVMSASQEREICRRFSFSPARVVVLGDLDPEPIRTRDVADPWNQPAQVLEESTERVSRCVTELVEELRAAHAGTMRGGMS